MPGSSSAAGGAADGAAALQRRGDRSDLPSSPGRGVVLRHHTGRDASTAADRDAPSSASELIDRGR